MLLKDLLFLFILIYFFLISLSSKIEGDNSDANIHKMSIKKLRTMLWQRGLECKGCAEKADYIDMLSQHLNDPIVKGRESTNIDQSNSNTEKDKSVEDVRTFLI